MVTSLVLIGTLVILAGPGIAQDVSALQAAAALEKVVVDTIANSERSVVAIGIFRTDREADDEPNRFGADGHPQLDAIPDAYGTGVVIDRRGLILTCWHVLKNRHKTTRQYIRLAGKPVWWEVRVRAADPYSDLAVLEIKAADDATASFPWQPMRLGDAAKLRKGQIVITLGNPYAISRDGEVSAGWGIVSNLRRPAPPREGRAAPFRRPTIHHFGTLIQTDAKLNLGSSGGALLNLKGEMVGLTTSLAALAGYEKSAGYAIAVDDTFRRALEKLKQGQEVEYGFLGVSPQDMTHHERVQGQQGVRIAQVIAGSPAAQTLRPGDIVTHIDGKPMTCFADLMLAVGRQPPESNVRFTVLRHHSRLGRAPTDLTVRLTKNRIVGEKVASVPKPTWRGLRVEYPAALRPLTLLGTNIPGNGVIVTHVDPDSSAAEAGLAQGARITHVNDTEVNTPSQFMRAAASRPGPVRLLTAGSADGPEVVVVPATRS